MSPAMMSTWFFGALLVFTPGVVYWGDVWPWLKGMAVISMTVFHIWLMQRMKSFQKGQNKVTGRQYRLMNEVPTVLMIVIVFSVTVRF